MSLSSTFRSAVVVCFAAADIAQASAQVNIEQLGHLSYQSLRGSELSNLWGYADEEGNEYALVGVNGTEGETGGLSVVDITDPTDPQEIFFHPGPASIWREIKVWNDHAYITTEAENGGITIVDLSPLPHSTDLPAIVWTDPGWNTSHSLFIDENGRLYIFGAAEGNGGTIMYDLTADPMAPVRVGAFDQWYVHDGFARGDTLYAAHILNGFFTIVDVSDPADPVLLGQQQTPNRFTHNTWLDASGRHLYTTDERDNSYVAAYDVSDPTDIQFLDKLRSDGGSGAIPHNTYWLPGDFLVQSYYTYGVSIYDCSRPGNLVEVGSYDTSPLTGGGFAGAWGVYPYLPSGRLIVSDIEEGLFILQPTYVRGCHLGGTITSSASGIPVGQAHVRITGTDAEETTDLSGAYGVGTLQPGTYTVSVSAAGYHTATIEGVVLETGELTVLDVQLVPLPTYAVSGTVRTAGSMVPVPGAQLWLVNGTFTFQVTSAADGSFTFPAVYDGSYRADIGAWGWHGACPDDLVMDGVAIEGWDIELERGYADDFDLDLGWQVTGNAVRGAWERGRPEGTFFHGMLAAPEADLQGDCRDKAYITGRAPGGNADANDVDGGRVLLTSPVFDVAGLVDPHVRYHYWFFNTGGSVPPDDSLVISLTDGVDTVVVQTVTAGGDMSEWRSSDIRIAAHITPTASMRLLVYTADREHDHIVEAGFDGFSVVGSGFSGVDENAAMAELRIWPVPATDGFTVMLPRGGDGLIRITDALGRQVGEVRTTGGATTLGHGLAAGTYVVAVACDDGAWLTRRVQVVR